MLDASSKKTPIFVALVCNGPAGAWLAGNLRRLRRGRIRGSWLRLRDALGHGLRNRLRNRRRNRLLRRRERGRRRLAWRRGRGLANGLLRGLVFFDGLILALARTQIHANLL